MLGKLLKNDLKKNMRWMWVLFTSTLVVASLTRGCKELGQSLAFFQILGIFFDSVFYALLINSLIQPFLRSFINFTKSLFGDESYLTHTLPVTKNQILNSKYLTAIIEICLSFVCAICSLLIMFASSTMFNSLKLFLSTLISGEFSLFLVLSIFVVLIIVEFIMFISIIFFSIIVAHKSTDKKVLKSFLITAVMSFISITVLAIIMIFVLLISGVDLTSKTLTLSGPILISIVLTGIFVYSGMAILFYFLAKKELNKGVNVD